MKTFKHLALATLAAPLMLVGQAQAGGPLANCDDGVPYLWGSGGQNIQWNADQGGLGPLSKAGADGLVGTSFARWTDVATATISYVQGADLPVDVDETNFVPFLEAEEPDGLSAIVYDDTGAIFELLFGPGSGVLGFAGPEWGDAPTCTITEGLSFLNGPEFVDELSALSIMVHEFGHFSNLAHTQTNGGILLGLAVGAPEASGPAPFDTFGSPTVADFANNGLLETMYPFFFGPQFGEDTLGQDDITAISRLYPTATYFATTASISGSILSPNGTTRLSGVNVIARNVANPFLDAVSALSGDFTDENNDLVSPVVGTYRFTGLTPGAQYAVFVDEILQGGFSTPPRDLPGPEEFASGAGESNADAPGTFAPIVAAAGATATGVNVIFNVPQPGQPLAVGDDGFVELFPDFPIDFCGVRYTSLFVNGNGSVSFGAGSAAFSESTAAALSGVPRVAGLWDDLNADAGGTVTFEKSASTFSVLFQGVPEFPATGANTFTITFKKKGWQATEAGTYTGNAFTITYGALSAADGLAGYSCGGAGTSGYEKETDLSAATGQIGGGANHVAAVFEDFTNTSASEVVDLTGTLNFKGANRIEDIQEINRKNDTVATATDLFYLPFNSTTPASATVIDANRDDVDFYKICLVAGDILAVEVVRGSLDSIIGIFDADTGELLIADDDGGNGLLSRLIVQVSQDINVVVGVTTFPDIEFLGTGETKGRYSLFVNTYRGTPIDIGDDDAVPVALARPYKFQGVNRNSLFVNSNGSISFGAGDTGFSATVPNFLAGPARISPLWTDLDPSGFLGNPGIVLVDTASKPAAVHFVSVSEFFSSSPNYFTAELADKGGLTLKYGPTARGPALTGSTPGLGAADPGETDLSKLGLSLLGTSYERFVIGDTTKGVSDFDLFFSTLKAK